MSTATPFDVFNKHCGLPAFDQDALVSTLHHMLGSDTAQPFITWSRRTFVRPAIAAFATMRADREAQAKQLSEVKADRDALAKQLSDGTGGNAKLLIAARAERDAMAKQLIAARAERDAMAKQLITTRAERDAMAKQLSDVKLIGERALSEQRPQDIDMADAWAILEEADKRLGPMPSS